MIHLENVHKTYRRPEGAVQALAGIDLHVAAGEFLAVRGPSGCGKTTLLSVVGALSMPTSGRVRVAGADLNTLGWGELARFRAEKIGFVFQMFHLVPYLSVLDNVALAAPSTRDARAAAEPLLRQFGLEDRLLHRPAELSAGQRQRVAMARALIRRPALLLADEPTGNLDAQSAGEVLDLLAEYHEQGGTVLLVTHQEQAASRAQRTVLLRQGAVVGEPQEA